MLIVQYKLNNDYKIELDALSRQLEEIRAEKDAKLDEFSKLLDIRAARIRKLEQQLSDVAYGTRQFTVNSTYLFRNRRYQGNIISLTLFLFS